VFRGIEPDWALKPTFFNRAHNEVLETAITGGIAALAAVSVFLLWFLRHLFRAWRGIGRVTGYEAGQGTGKASDVALARLGSVVVLLLLLASLVDYPLRTPLLGAVLALAVAWLASGSQQRKIGRQSTSQFA
jgi:Na+/H+ antiporter NhaD/arsenite permease-like protein